MPTLRSRKTTTPMLALSTAMKRRRLLWPLSPNGTHNLLCPSRCSTPLGASIKSTGCNNSWQPPLTMGERTSSKSVATGLNACHRAIQAIALRSLSCLHWIKRMLLVRKRMRSQTCQVAQFSRPCRPRDKCPSVARLRRLRNPRRRTVQGEDAQRPPSLPKKLRNLSLVTTAQRLSRRITF